MTLRPELSPLPERIKILPVDERGYPVPWFVTWIEGKPDFRVADAHKWIMAVKESRCWVCGSDLGSFRAFVLGPMCGITRSTTEPACHLECARWSVQNCPFLTRPHMVRRQDGLPEGTDSAGIPLLRNPAVSLIWVTRSFKTFRDHRGFPMIQVGEPTSMEAWCKGRQATQKELLDSVNGGFPALMEVATQDGDVALRTPMVQKDNAVRMFQRFLWGSAI